MKIQLAFFFIILASFGGIYLAASNYIAKSNVKELAEKVSYYEGLSQSGSFSALKRQINKLYLDARTKSGSSVSKQISNLNSFSPLHRLQLGRLELLLASLETNLKNKNHYLCGSLDNFYQASLLGVSSNFSRIALADALQHLDNKQQELCEDLSNPAISDLKWKEQLKQAESLAPNLSFSLFRAARIWFRAGEFEEAFRLYKKMQENSPSLSYRSFESLFKLVSNEDDLEQILPSRFPQLLNWLNHFSFYENEKFLNWKKTFSNSAKKALNQLELEYNQGQVSSQLYHEYLKRLSRNELTFLDDELRKRLIF